MTCTDTVASGFYFWIGKIAAEFVVTGGGIAIIMAVYLAALFYFSRKWK
jgi:hypothetical protein